ncbi:MAG: hypothetical protein WAT17_01305 [Candidatus Saccharimonadales bacterium]
MMARIDLYPVGAEFIPADHRQAVDMDTSNSPRMLLSPANGYGSSFHDMIQIFDIDRLHLEQRTRFFGSPEKIKQGIRPLRLELGNIAARASEAGRAAAESNGGTSVGHGSIEHSIRSSVADIIDDIAQRLKGAYDDNPETPLIKTLETIGSAYGEYLTGDGTRVNIKSHPLPPLADDTARSSIKTAAQELPYRLLHAAPLDIKSGPQDMTVNDTESPLAITSQEREIIGRIRTAFPRLTVMTHRDPETNRSMRRGLDDSDVIGYALRVLEQMINQASAAPQQDVR